MDARTDHGIGRGGCSPCTQSMRAHVRESLPNGIGWSQYHMYSGSRIVLPLRIAVQVVVRVLPGTGATVLRGGIILEQPSSQTQGEVR